MNEVMSYSQELKMRTQDFAFNILVFVENLPQGDSIRIIGRQLRRSGASVGANYRAACRAKSRADFIAKMGIVEEEADEVLYWLELLLRTKASDELKLQALSQEASELLAITVSSIKTAKSKK